MTTLEYQPFIDAELPAPLAAGDDGHSHGRATAPLAAPGVAWRRGESQ